MKKLLALLTAVFTTVALSFAAAPASAYPIGQRLVLNLSSTTAVPGDFIDASASNAYPGCDVVFTSTLNKKIQQRFSKPANESGTTGSVRFSITKSGIYNLSASYSCNYFAEKDSRNVTSGKQTTTTVTGFTASGNTFSVNANVSWGAFPVEGLSGTAVFTNNSGSKLASTTFTSDANGNVFKLVSVRKTLASGTYRVTVTFNTAGEYLGSSDTETTVKATIVKLAKAKQYAPKIK